MPDDPYWIVTVAFAERARLTRIMCCQFLHTIELVSNSCTADTQQYNNNKCVCFLSLSRPSCSWFAGCSYSFSFSFQCICRFHFRFKLWRARAVHDVYFIPSSFTELVKSIQSASQPPIRLFITSIPNVWNRVSSNIWVISRMHIQSHNTLVCQIIVESYKDSQLLLPSFIFLIGFSISLIIFTSQKLFLEIRTCIRARK